MGNDGKQERLGRGKNPHKKFDGNDLAGNKGTESQKDLAGDKAETTYLDGKSTTGMRRTGAEKEEQ